MLPSGDLVAGGSFIMAGNYVSAYWARWSCSWAVGDLNCDGRVSFKDINPFVVYLADFSTWQALYPGCPPQNGDINNDGTYPSFKDINPFVVLLSGG